VKENLCKFYGVKIYACNCFDPGHQHLPPVSDCKYFEQDGVSERRCMHSHGTWTCHCGEAHLDAKATYTMENL